ncbi:MAG: SusC/RagA family TonB-linked outer membrane protein [Sanguibacteroides justesenii]|nr:SusC/RagA family TonB-linked outer membrane protein [Sanguibacteroides justesenii]
MKKKRMRWLFMRNFELRKLLKIMKLSVILLLVSMHLAVANVGAQAKVTIEAKTVTYLELFNQIKQQTGFTVVYSNNELDKYKTVEAGFVKSDLKAVLDKIFVGTRLVYEIMDEFIVLKVAPDEKKKALNIIGLVTDKSNVPLPGVTVVVKGLSVGTATDQHGRYRLNIPEVKNLSLLFSFIGMKTQEVKYVGKDTINVVMEEDSKTVEEVVVTGYQTIKKRSMAGSTSSVKAEDLLLNGTQTLEQALQGKLPGVAIVNQSGLTGTRQKVRVRGTSTLVGNAEPVWVVDGIIQEDPLPFNSNDLTNMGDTDVDMIKNFVGGAISWLNPNDIEDITVLKDASSTAIYGVKAANGVIVITTKKGERGRMSLGYSGSFSFSAKMTYNKLELMNSKQRVEASREAYEKGSVLKTEEPIGYMALALAYKRREISYDEFNSGVKKLETNNTDWFDILFQTPFSHNHSISVSGGNAKTTYRASIGVNNANNTAKGNSQKSYSGNVNVSTTFWDQLYITFGLSGNVSKTKAFNAANPYSYASTTNRAIPCYNEDGSLHFYRTSGGGFYNILHELHNSGNRNTSNSINSNFSIRWVMGHGLTLSSIIGYNYSTSFGESWYTEQSNNIRNIRGYEFGEYGPGDVLYIESPLPYGGTLTVNETRNNNYTWRNQLEFVKTFDRHVINVMLGQEARSNKYDGYSQTNYGYMPDRGKSFAEVPPVIGEDKRVNMYTQGNSPQLVDRKANYVSFYGNFSYMFDDRYAINGSIRTDASNRFGQDKSARFQPVWSIGLRWNLGREHWLEGQNLLNDISFRASYGWQGNVAENVGPDLIAKIERINTVTGEYKMTISRLPTPGLKWEKNKSINLGVDFSILDRRVNGTFEYYYKSTEDMITERKVPYENGVTTLTLNGGNMTNSGWDLSFSFVPVRTKDFVWSLSMNTSRANNKLKSTLEPTGKWTEAVSGGFNKEGYPVSSFWAFRFKGLNPENGAPMIDFTGANTESAELDVTQYMKHAGKLEADFTAGLSTSFRFKNLFLSANFYLSTGNQKFLASPYSEKLFASGANTMASEYQNLSSQLVNRWRKPGDENFTNIPSLPNPETSAALRPFYNKYTTIYPYDAWAYSDIRVADAWYLRCNNISLSYQVPREWTKSFARSVSFSCSVSNPFQIVSKDFHGRDPEVASGAQPLSRHFSFSMSMSF